MDWVIPAKFGLLIDFGLLKRATSPNPQPEVILRRIRRHYSTAGGPISMQFGMLMQNNMPITVHCGWHRHIAIHDGHSNHFRFAKKLTSAILEFYFRFRFRPHYDNRHVILHQPVKISSKSGFLPRDAMHQPGLYRHAVSVCPSVIFVDCVKTSNRIFRLFLPSGSH